MIDGAEDLEVEILAQSRVDQGDRPRTQLALLHLATAEEAGDLVERPLCRRQTDADKARGSAAAVGRLQRGEPFEQQRQEDAALVAAQGVDLIDDDVRDAAQGFPGAGGEQQVQRLGRGDEDVGRPA